MVKIRLFVLTHFETEKNENTSYPLQVFLWMIENNVRAAERMKSPMLIIDYVMFVL